LLVVLDRKRSPIEGDMTDTEPEKVKRSVAQYVVEVDMAYLATRPRMIPKGRVLVHNHAKHSRVTKVNLNGFRAWYQTPNETLEPCRCGWARLPHYVVNRDVAASIIETAPLEGNVRVEQVTVRYDLGVLKIGDATMNMALVE
jgi:hypothetical protein